MYNDLIELGGLPPLEKKGKKEGDEAKMKETTEIEKKNMEDLDKQLERIEEQDYLNLNKKNFNEVQKCKLSSTLTYYVF